MFLKKEKKKRLYICKINFLNFGMNLKEKHMILIDLQINVRNELRYVDWLVSYVDLQLSKLIPLATSQQVLMKVYVEHTVGPALDICQLNYMYNSLMCLFDIDRIADCERQS